MSCEEIEQNRAQIAKVQAYRAELALIHDAIKRTRGEIASLGPSAQTAAEIGRASRELAAIVSGTEQATQQILRGAEEIDRSANTLSAAFRSEHEKGLANDIRDRVVQIYEACNFQDLTGQRVGRVVEILAFLEQHIGCLMEMWSGIEQFKPEVSGEPSLGDRKFLNGPKLADEPGHSSQDDIDALFGTA